MEKLIFPFIVFLLNPLVGIFSLVCLFWYNKEGKDNYSYLYALALMISLFLGLQNVGKELVGDLKEYRKIFLSVPQFDTCWDFLFRFGKEPVYYGYNYLSYYLFGGSWPFFILSITVINYMLLSYAVIQTGKIIHTNYRNIIVTLLFLLFFFQEFASCGHMIRQCLAQSITVAFFVSWYIEGKKRWWIGLLAVGVHSASLPVLGIGLIPMLKDKLTLKTVFAFGGIAVALIVSFYYLSPILSRVPFLSYILVRANQTNLLGTDTWQKSVGLDLLTMALIAVIISLIYYLYSRYNTFGQEDKIENCHYETITVPYINLTIIIVLAILVWNAMGAYYLLMRYFFFIYAFQNVILLLFLHNWNPRSKYVYTTIGVSLLFVYYMVYYVNGVCRYYPLENMLLFPIPLYFVN